MISVRQLRYLDAIARHGHFGRAADAVAISQPALSMQIKELETTLDLQLVERSPKGASLTTDGQAIADRARRILTDISALEDFARARAPVLSGPLRLGVIPSVAPYLLPKVLPTLKALYPELALQISETQTERLVAQLLDGDIDLLLLALPILDPGITTRVLFDDPFVLAAPSRVAQNADPLSLLAEEKVLLLEDGHCLRDQALSFCADRKTGAIDAFGASTLATVVQLVAADLGVTLLPAMAASLEAGRAPIRLLPFQDPAPARSIGLAWRTTAARTRDFETFGDLVLEAVAPTIAKA